MVAEPSLTAREVVDRLHGKVPPGLVHRVRSVMKKEAAKEVDEFVAKQRKVKAHDLVHRVHQPIMDIPHLPNADDVLWEKMAVVRKAASEIGGLKSLIDIASRMAGIGIE